MLPSIGFPELLIVAILAIIIVGPKDLPVMMRTLGQWVGRIKAMGQEFKDAFEEMGRDSELAELRKEIEDLKKMGNLENLSDEALAEDMRAIDNELREGTTMKSHPRTNPAPKIDDSMDDIAVPKPSASDKGGDNGKA